jgi:hypothetical protein
LRAIKNQSRNIASHYDAGQGKGIYFILAKREYWRVPFIILAWAEIPAHLISLIAR